MATVGFSPEESPTVRQRLVAAAIEVFAEEGYDGARVQDIARRAGLSVGAIYGNFRDKSDLLAEAIDAGMARVERDLESARRAGANAAELIELMARGLAEPGDPAQRQLTMEAFAAARRDPQVRERVLSALLNAEIELARVVERARREGSISRQVPTAPLVRLLMSIGVGYAQLTAAGAGPPEPQAWRRLVHQFIAGLAPEGD
jgi:AcrR family transcriptional regulator